MQTNRVLINTSVYRQYSEENVMKERKICMDKIDMEEDCTLHASSWQSELGDNVIEDHCHNKVLINPDRR